MIRVIPAALLVAFSTVAPSPGRAQVHELARMTTEEIRELDRERTVVLLPGGILEQHGPYLPSYADGYLNEWTTTRLAEAIVARPGWQVLIFPPIPLGTGGANEIGRRYVFPGTYAVRAATLRAVYMDLATELGEQGFRWVFIVHDHGAPNHNRMLDQAGEYFRDVYGGRMVHLMGLLPVFAAETAYESGEMLSDAERAEEGFSVHAGAAETASLLFVRPEHVRPEYRQAPPQRGDDWDDLVDLARAPGWPGYFGAPALATASMGAGAMNAELAAVIDVALRILDGEDDRSFARVGELARESAANAAIDRDALGREEQVRLQQERWLRERGYR